MKSLLSPKSRNALLKEEYETASFGDDLPPMRTAEYDEDDPDGELAFYDEEYVERMLGFPLSEIDWNEQKKGH